MRTRRPISINNSLVHGICNYSCRLCGINKTNYRGPKEFQSYVVTRTLIQRILEAARSGIYVRYVANSGDGEATLHPEFGDRLRMFGEMLREWNVSIVPPPEVSVVTNGSLLNQPETLIPLIDNSISLIISFPTSDPESYGLIMTGDSGKGETLLSSVLPGIERAMVLRAEGRLSRLYFHISPPEIDIVRRDFPETIATLTKIAYRNALDEIELVLFPAKSNRSGLLRNSVTAVDIYRDLFRRYNGHTINGVKISMKLVIKRFFSSTGEIIDLVRSFRFPCLWNANFFIAADGSSICCNDQSLRNPLGNILYEPIEVLMRYKEQYMPGKVCAGCNQSPQKLRGSFQAVIFSLLARQRLLLAKIHDRYSNSGDGIPESASTADSACAALIENDCGDGSIDSNGENANNVFSDSRLTRNIDEMKDAFGLVYKTYLQSDLQNPDPSSMRIGFYNLLPSSHLLIVKRDGEVYGTLTLVREINGRLPIDELFSEEIGKIRGTGSLICELSALAVDTDLSNGERWGILLSLFRKAFILGKDLLGCTDFCMMIHPRHCDYYHRKFYFESIGDVKPFEKVNGALAIPMRLNFVTGRERVRKSNPQLYQYFYGSDSRNILERTMHELNDRRNQHGIEYINSLCEVKPDLLKDLTANEKQILLSYYPELRQDQP